MKRILFSLVSLAAAGAVCAQSSVTVFGIVDAGFARVSAGGKHVNSLSNSGISYSRLGFRGVEDLGGGLTAGFWLEGALANDTGQGAGPTTAFTFQRRSTVSLSGPFGEVRLGRDTAPSYLNPAWFDPFQGTGIGQPTAYTMLGAPIRTNNGIGYFLPNNLGGFYGQAQYAFGEELSNVVNKNNGNYWGARLGYANKQLNVAVATGKLKTGTPTVPGDVSASNIAASYSFGTVTPMAFWATEKTNTGARIDATLLGATVTLGAGELRFAFSRYDRKNSGDDWTKAAVGYVHNLSKRTALYGTYARIGNKGNSAQVVTSTGVGSWPISTSIAATPGGSSNGVEFGIRHAF